MEIYLIRHGQTAYNVGEKRIRGTADVPLSEFGMKQAESVGKTFASINLDKIYYSDLSRVRVVAEKIKEYQENANLIAEPLVFAMSFGELEGKTLKEAFPSDKKRALWLKDPHQIIPPGGETFYQVIDRIHRFFMRLRTQKDQTIAVVTHSSIISLIFIYLSKQPLKNFWSWKVDTCSISLIKYRREDGDFGIIKINDNQHLQYLD